MARKKRALFLIESPATATEGVRAISAIITLTMNPSVDLFGTAERLLDESKTRCQETGRQPGGGGINVARNLRRLGADVLAVFPRGGLNGELLERLLRDEGLPCLGVPVDSETRQNLALTETSTTKMYHFVFPGPVLQDSEWQLCLDRISFMDPAPEYLVISGSLPRGTPSDFYGRVAKAAAERNTKVVLDVSGSALQPPLDEGVYLAKLNRKEFAQLGYTGPDDPEAQLTAMEDIVAKGYVEVLVVTLGPKGALLVSRAGDRWALTPPPTKIVSHVGAGDSFVAVMTYQLHRGNSVPEAFRYGVAAATAAVKTAGNQIDDMSTVDDIYRQLSTHPERAPTGV
ncbi:1-phosphofructokinase family hexose kinase [Marinimicrobium sp. ABcell2]|uniref:1-phosphofructokinase family hexose kinase n=1 Tax=Marinimicrobium sp. ABcell2 TaxID=3069751 RepID=UPI0027ADFD3A|nr:1-phosphofructokinase family hexose kinase [Marinimicrobium sp. ABcell2]MDQ2076848.1 1-phosphofructokinase family hexose kinase [Marinimicrobium sp. ABcell2]